MKTIEQLMYGIIQQDCSLSKTVPHIRWSKEPRCLVRWRTARRDLRSLVYSVMTDSFT